MFIKKIYTALVAIVGFTSAAQAGVIISPFATDLTPDSYTASSTYLPPSSVYLAENAFNGTGYWNAGDYGWAWIQADMGSIQTLTEIKIQTAQAPNGVTQYQVFLSDSFIGNDYGLLTPIFSHNGYTSTGTVLDVLLSTPQTGRYLQILAHGGPSWTALGDVDGRIDWQQPGVTTPPGGNNIPEPGVIFLIGLGLLSIGYRRKK